MKPRIHKIEQASQRRKLLDASEMYYTALSEELASGALQSIEKQLEGIVDRITKEIAKNASSPFEDGKTWFTVAELKKRWNCSNNFICSVPDLAPHYLGGSPSMKRYLAADVYRVEGLISRAKHKELKKLL